MCTVSYLPLPNGELLLTSSRDEKTARPSARFPVSRIINDQTVYFPQDPQGHGSWIATARKSDSALTTVCLLNGGFFAHKPRPPYRHSRGLVVLDVFHYSSATNWLANYDFQNLEPFTLIIVQSGRLWEVRWDGQTVYSRQPDPTKPAIWSSVTLYWPAIVARRETWFQTWLRQQVNFTVAGIRQFHKQAGAGDNANGMLMNRGNGLQTVSLTTIRHGAATSAIFYEDLITSQLSYRQLTTAHEHSYAY
ncbi:NRDE family protein [Larkinella rosea]|uniref:NRDE family protein n=1 Tax=Larkinella rosea TaxID=2025312 RepID=A0A3P1BSA1_9BACT|nr:NRDE family protein [Larkinella rosea]RRB03985.1 hypothetical protein EHT25_10670 [Larkinella rosea]